MSRLQDTKRSFSKPVLSIISLNIEGLSAPKEVLLHQLCQTHNCDILCLQETHRDDQQTRPKVAGMRLVAEIPHRQYGSAVLAKPDLQILSVSTTVENCIEIITVELSNCTVSSIYKPPNVNFSFKTPNNYHSQKTNFVVGDFNSHSSTWGYTNEDDNGEAVLEWADNFQLHLIHDSKQPPSFNSGRWQRGFNPDLIFVSEHVAQQCVKSVCNPIPNTQHRPIMCQLYSVLRPTTIPFRRRYNFGKANWQKFSTTLDTLTSDIQPTSDAYEEFVEAVQKASRASIPRGCRVNYVQGLTSEAVAHMDNYFSLFEEDPFSEDTISAGKQLLSSIAEAKRDAWMKLMEETDLARDSRKAWKLLKRLSNDPTKSSVHANISANDIANQLLTNGRTNYPVRKLEQKIYEGDEARTNDLSRPFNLNELQKAIQSCKSGKAAGLDDITTEQIKHFGPTTKEWLLNLFNCCFVSLKIPKIWRKSRVIAVLKPGKEPSDPKNFRPISILCHLYKIMERMILNRLIGVVDQLLIPQQAGFRPGKSCTSQVLHLTQHIEDGFEMKKITSVAFVDLSAAYDTVHHRTLLCKLYRIVGDIKITKMIATFLENRRFFVEFQGRRSRWRNQRNGLPQGSVLAPILFNIYTNDQPLPAGSKSFIYADDLALAVQTNNFDEAEISLSNSLEELGIYYDKNQLKPNPEKTQICAFHLRHAQAARKLQVSWKGKFLEHCFTPKYLGVTLDRTLTYKRHCQALKQKVCARNNLLRKLSGTSWGTKPQILRTSALALCYAAGEYACPVWYRSVHAKQVDIALTESCRIITGCLKPTPIEKIQYLAGIAPGEIRREIAANKERLQSSKSKAHPLFGYLPATQRLKSRRSFLRTSVNLEGKPEAARIKIWKEKTEHLSKWMEPRESLPCGHKEEWTTWKALNRLRTGVGRTKLNMEKWGFSSNTSHCNCGEIQTTEHLCNCILCPSKCTMEDLIAATPNAIDVARHWSRSI